MSKATRFGVRVSVLGNRALRLRMAGPAEHASALVSAARTNDFCASMNTRVISGKRSLMRRSASERCLAPPLTYGRGRAVFLHSGTLHASDLFLSVRSHGSHTTPRSCLGLKPSRAISFVRYPIGAM